MPKSTYEYQKRRCDTDRYERERLIIVKLFEDSHRTYGYRRMRLALRNETGEIMSGKTMRRLMKEGHLNVACGKTRRFSTFRGTLGICENVLRRRFKADEPGRVLVTDITQMKAGKDKLYLSPLIDLFNGEVISWTASLSPNMDLVVDMMEKAKSRLPKGAQPLVHTDQGFHYWNIRYLNELKDIGATQSMSRKGNCLDNACAESFFGRLKVEFYHRETFKDVSQLSKGIENYIEWYNHDRIRESLDGLSPIDYRIRYERKAVLAS